MHLVLMRHGEPVRDAADALDPALSGRGADQVSAAVPYVLAAGIEVIYSSPQMRARQTAEMVAEPLGLPIVFDDALVEFDHGAPYVHYDDAQADVWRHYLAGDLTPWGTTAAQFHDRVSLVMNRIATEQAGRRVLVVCHGGVINVWTCQLFGVPDRLRVMEPGYASLHRYEREDDVWSVRSLNEVAPVRVSTLK
ncbi:histidine phosphatase family protein [Nocardia alni]|uniref:histidine phosphatase family protein n=1 Tax=Nocardia alni TaxID=2815723 RepID=UPI001C21FF24|nr:histidine phosphatase family protein [Nocardia alni]